MKHLAIVTARGGSKGVPGKNIKPLGGIPLIAYTVVPLLAARRFDRVILSSDSEAIIDVGRRFGLYSNYRRPAALATDEATSRDVVLDVFDWLQLQDGYVCDFATIFQPTSPFRTVGEIQTYADAAESLSVNIEGILGVVEVGHFHPRRMFSIAEDKLLHPIFETDGSNPRRQDLGERFLSSGGYFGFRPEVLRRSKSCIPARAAPFVVEDFVAATNIDEPYDFEVADYLVRYSARPRIKTVRETLAASAPLLSKS